LEEPGVPLLVSDNLVYVLRCDVVEVAFISKTKKNFTNTDHNLDLSRPMPRVIPTDRDRTQG
jgi:hypothetical protein